MANTKISALTGATTPLAGTEVLPIVQSSTTKQVSVANLTAGRAVSAASLALTTSPLPATSGGTGSSSAFTANGVAYASSTTVLATGSALQFNGTSLGVGVTPSTSGAGKTVEVGTSVGNIIRGGGQNDMNVESNTIYNSGFKYANNGFANRFGVGVATGEFQWLTAPSGTAGNAATFTQGMTLGSGGNLLLGTTSNPSGCRFVVEGSRAASFSSTQSNIGGISASCNSSNSDEPTIYAGNGNSGSSGVGTFYSSMGNGNGAQSNTNCYHLKAITQGVNIWYLYGNGTTSFSSDARLKKNIETARNGYAEDLCKLRVVKYHWNANDDASSKELGLIAQEVEQVFPGLVQDSGDTIGEVENTKVLKGSVLPFMLLKALQEQQAMIDSLKARLDAANL
jgi:hypothetical protein